MVLCGGFGPRQRRRRGSVRPHGRGPAGDDPRRWGRGGSPFMKSVAALSMPGAKEAQLADFCAIQARLCRGRHTPSSLRRARRVDIDRPARFRCAPGSRGPFEGRRPPSGQPGPPDRQRHSGGGIPVASRATAMVILPQIARLREADGCARRVPRRRGAASSHPQAHHHEGHRRPRPSRSHHLQRRRKTLRPAIINDAAAAADHRVSRQSLRAKPQAPTGSGAAARGRAPAAGPPAGPPPPPPPSPKQRQPRTSRRVGARRATSAAARRILRRPHKPRQCPRSGRSRAPTGNKGQQHRASTVAP